MSTWSLVGGGSRHRWRRTCAAMLRCALALGVALVWALPAQAQTGEISGRVTDVVTGQPIDGALVTAVGTNVRAQTRMDGLYNLVGVPAGQQRVRVAIIGYATQTATVNVQSSLVTTVDFELNRSVISLDEMVVTGQAGAVSRREIGNSIATIGAETMANLPIQDVGQALQGMAPGVTVMDNSGQVGMGQQFRKGIRRDRRKTNHFETWQIIQVIPHEYDLA